jgi:serpin B
MVLIAEGASGQTADQISATFHFGSDLKSAGRAFSDLNGRFMIPTGKATGNPNEPEFAAPPAKANDPGPTEVPPGSRSLLGIDYQPNPSGGFLLTGIKSGSQAERAGIRAGDLIFAIDRERVNSEEDLTRHLDHAHRVVQVALMRPAQHEPTVVNVESGPAAPQGVGVPAADAMGQASPRAPALILANALWIQEGIKLLDSYLVEVRSHHGASVRDVDFVRQPDQAAEIINHWIALQTSGRITNIVDRNLANSETRLILTNALYFRGRWKKPFPPSMAPPVRFKGTSNPQAQVRMMRTTGTFRLVRRGGYQAIELPYAKSTICMVILLPDRDDGLHDLVNELDLKILADPLAGAEPLRVDLRVPKFSITSKIDLTGILRSQMPLAFSRDEADFSGMTGGKDLRLSAVVHQTFLRVDEAGSEAAAATAVGIVPRSPPDAEFIADHPFLFLIRDNTTGTVLFLGTFTTP